jgi:hypothetical protein
MKLQRSDVCVCSRRKGRCNSAGVSQTEEKEKKNKARRKFFSGGISRFSALCFVVVGRSHPTHGGVDDAPLFKQEREREGERWEGGK